jgi:hypothetical protein
MFDSLDPFELHVIHPEPTVDGQPAYLEIRVRSSDEKRLNQAVRDATKWWRRGSILAAEPDKVSPLRYDIRLINTSDQRMFGPLTTLFMREGIVLEIPSRGAG